MREQYTPLAEIFFHDWRSYYEVDDDPKGICAAVRASPVASQHCLREYCIIHKGQLIWKHMIAGCVKDGAGIARLQPPWDKQNH